MGATYSARAHAMLNALVAGHRGRASRAAGGVLKCAHPWPGRLPNPVETVKTTYNGRTYLGYGYRNGCSPRPDRDA
eukprot:6760954-Prymnesium_polylepis.1